MTKKELRFYLMADRIMNGGRIQKTLKGILLGLIKPNYILAYLEALRKVEYFDSNRNLIGGYWKFRLNKLGYKTGFSIAPGVLGYGVVIPHYGTIVVGSGNKMGNYAVLHTCVCITQGAKKIGDALYCSTGAKIVNDIELKTNVSIGANAVVNKSFDDNSILLTGIPADRKKEEKPWYIRDGETYINRIKECERLRKDMGL